MFVITLGCKSSVEFDPGPFAGGDKSDKTLLTFQVKDASGNPIEGAYVVSYRNLAPLHLRAGEGYTNVSGEIVLDDQTHTKKGYATIVAPGYNSKKINLDLIPKTDNLLAVTLSAQSVLKVMSYNILVGFSNDAKLRQDFAKWVELYNPDVILFQEVSNFTDDTFSSFASTFGHDYTVRTKTTTGIPTAISSKYPMIDVKMVVQTGTLHHGYVSAVISGVRFFSVHLCPYEVDNERNTYRIDRQDEIEIIMADANQYASTPVVLAGDLNSHNSFDRDSFGNGYRYGDRDHGVYNTLKSTSFFDTYTLLNTEFKSTWPVAEVAKNGPNVGARLDYMFVNSNLRSSVVFSDIIYSKVTDKLSDHYPTYVEIKTAN